MGFWAAMREVYHETCEQRCWFHKTGNVLNKMPKSIHAKAKVDIREIWMAETRESANNAFNTFLEKYGAKYPEAPQERSRRPADLLRLSSRTLEAFANHQPNRVNLRAYVTEEPRDAEPGEPA